MSSTSRPPIPSLKPGMRYRPGGADAVPRPSRLGLLTGLSAGLAAAVVVLSACSGGGSATTSPTVRPLAALEPVDEGALVPKVRDLLRSRQAARTANPSVSFDRFAVTAGLSALASTSTGATTAAIPAFSGTTTQEAGVDEADLLKTDGRLLFALDGNTLRDAQGVARPQVRVARPGADGTVEPLGTLPLDVSEPSAPKGLLLSGGATRLVAMAASPSWSGQPCPPGLLCAMPVISSADPVLHLQIADVSASGSLTTARRLALDGQLVGSRRVGDMVYLVTTWSPRLAYEALPADASASEREAALAALKSADVLPGVRIDGGARQPLVSETDCLMQQKASSLALTVTTLMAIDLASPTLTIRTRCFFGGTEGLYMSAQNLYLATTRSPQPVTGADGRSVFPTDFVTDVHKFALDGLGLNYRASGEVKGHLGWDADRIALRMSEHAGDLRIISYTGSSGWILWSDAAATAQRPASAPATASPATLTILRESTSEAMLKSIATLPNERRPAALGKPGEQIYGVRFSGDTGYLVTFRRTDPLYVLDLKDPTDPKAAGALEVPGFSDVLLPLPQGLLLGVGRDADAAGVVLGLKVALFDVRDPTNPALISSKAFGAQGSASAADFSSHGLNLLQVGPVARIGLPMSLRETDWGPDAQHVLKRFEVDTAGRTLSWRTDVAPPSGTDPFDVSADRSVQIGDAVFFLSQGRLTGGRW
ncbi:MAG: beta-propeller domain-containing protein [Burkholderiales bacterium]